MSAPGTDEDGGTRGATSSMVLVENVQDSCPPDMLNLLVENISGRRAVRDFYVEMVPELQSAVITFTCDIDIHRFIQSFSSSLRVTILQLKVKLLEETTSVQVENLPPNTSDEHLTFYFESPRHGGVRVQETVILPEEGTALVTFYDTEAVKTILRSPHVFNRTPINVYPYYPSLNIHLYGTNEPHMVLPTPIEFTISPYILEHILNNQQIKSSIDTKMENNYCKIKWPSPDCMNPIIKIEIPPTLSKNPRAMAKVNHTWTEKVSAAFSLIISRYKVIECKMHPSAWEDIKVQISTAAYDGVLVKPTADAEKVFLAGAIRDVNKIEQTFKKLVEENSRKAERRSKQTTKTEPMSAALYHVICSSGLEKKILAEAPEMKMEYDPSTHNVRLTGLRDEVLETKCEILSVIQNLKSKSIQLNPHVLQFLKFADNDEISCVLFISQNINAVIEMEENSIKLTGHTKKDLTDAEEQIGRELICQRILIEDKNVLQSPEWKSLQSHLLQSHCSEMCTVIIEEFPPGAENDVVVAGLASSVHKSYKEIHEFLNNKTVMEVRVPISSRVMLQFIEETKHQKWQEIKTKAKVEMNENNVSFFAPRIQAEDAAAQLRSLLSSLYCDSLRIDKSGAKNFCKKHDKTHTSTAKTEFNCVILLETGEDNKQPDNARYEVKLQRGVALALYQDDLCRHKADVIVNAANDDLQLSGGLGLALLKAAGPKLQDDCKIIIRKKGRLSIGESVITDAGNLQCKQVIHTAGPRWDSQPHKGCEQLLQRAITTSLELAAENGHSSIAIPAISSGIYGFPLEKCAKNILAAIEDYVEKHGSTSSVRRIHIVDMNAQTIQIFSEVLRTRFGDQKTSGAPAMTGPQTPIRSEGSETPQVTMSQEDKEVQTTEGLIIRLVQKKIEDAITDVMVNTVGSDLDLTTGNVSQAIYNRAGAGLQQLLTNNNLGAQAPPGTVIPTDGCNLGCQHVLHVVAPQWDNGQGASETILQDIIQHCLMWTDQQSMKSLSIPALGTGTLAFPKPLVAAAMLDAIFQFSSKNKPQSLQEVEIVLHPSDKNSIQAFNNELVNYTDDGSASKKQSSGATSVLCGTVTRPSSGVHEMRIGSLSFQVKTGDITKERAEVIVNSSNKNFTLNAGVSKAILEAAGPVVQLGSQPHKGYIITSAGNLVGSSWIFHVCGPSQPADIKKIVLDCLQESEKQQAACIAFPALGTGAGGLAAGDVADAMLDGVIDFFNSGSVKSIRIVKVVLFQQHMLNNFYASMKKKEGTALSGPKSFLNKLTALLPPVPTFLMPKIQKKPEQKMAGFQLLENTEPVVFSLCSDDKKKVEETKRWLQQQIEYKETTLTDDCIPELKECDRDKILTLQRKFQVSVVYRPPDPSIRISGIRQDVLEVANEIQKIVSSVKERKIRERAAELTGNLVEWRYQHGAKMIAFNAMANLELEEAKSANKTQVTVQSRNQKITVDLKNLKATDKHGSQIAIERVIKHGDHSVKLPDSWCPMNNVQLMEVDLAASSPEYIQIMQLFRQTCSNIILKIQRVQNKDLWQNYQIRLRSINTKNRTTTNEKRLFHGTDINSIQHINHNGFNRSYAGRNAAMYGNGTYFAVNAIYSARHFSPPDANGHKHLYLARVLTGVFCAGQKDMKAPPAKNPANPTDLYDSVTDNPASPSMFIIFNDIQAYPEYHITFQ
ncbi:protein mono-ADP-ribosyltransferase PARP14-like isoform X2 [Bufo bufo]|nr:protein mono-ADP-ribosyltransferase PARP14-like isoform X2 [Bufo bufo]